MPTKKMRADDLHITPLLQPRSSGVNKETVAEYATDMKRGDKFPPLLAYKITDRSFKKPALVAGFTRLEAYAKAEVDQFEVEVREGTFAEARLAGWLSNLLHGLRYTNADKRAFTEWAVMLWRDDSAAVLAGRINVSDEFVRKVRKELTTAGKLESVEKVNGKDGVPQTASKPNSNKNKIPVPTVGTGIKPSSELIPTVGGSVKPKPAAPHLLETEDEAEATEDEELEEKSEPKTEPTSTPATMGKDGLGNPIPRGLVDTFGDPTLSGAIDRIKAVHRELVSIEQHVSRVLAPKSKEFFPYALCGEAMKSLATAADRAAEGFAQLEAGVPFCICPQCKGDGCKGCRNSGVWPRHRHDNRQQYGDAA